MEFAITNKSRIKAGLTAATASAAALAIASAFTVPAYAINAPEVDDTFDAGSGTAAAEYTVDTVNTGSTTGEVTYTDSTATNATTITIPATIKLGGKTYKVVAIAAKAFTGTKATKVTAGKNIQSMAKKAFTGSKVKTVTLKTKKLTKKSARGAFAGSKVTKIIVNVGTKAQNKKYVKKYSKIFKRVQSGKTKIVAK